MALAMASEAAAAAGGATRIALVFTRPMQMLLAERFLRRQAFANGRNLADLETHLQLILSKHLRMHSRSGWATRYVFVGIDDDALRVLMTENGIPADSLLLLTQRTALYTRWSLKPVSTNRSTAASSRGWSTFSSARSDPLASTMSHCRGRMTSYCPPSTFPPRRPRATMTRRRGASSSKMMTLYTVLERHQFTSMTPWRTCIRSPGLFLEKPVAGARPAALHDVDGIA